MAVEEVPACLLCLSVDFVMCQYVNQQRVIDGTFIYKVCLKRRFFQGNNGILSGKR